MKKTAIAVVDLYKFGRGGHFAYWHTRFGREFSSRFDQVLLVSPDPASLETYFRSTAGIPDTNISFHRLPRGLKKTFDLQRLRTLPIAGDVVLHAFMMWAFDLPPVRIPQPEYRVQLKRAVDLLTFRTPWFAAEIPWGALTGISWHMRGISSPTADKERRVIEFFARNDSCKAFMHADEYVGGRIEKAHSVPDFENVELPTSPTELALRVRKHAGNHFCIGAVGILAGYRCIDEILPLALAHPEIRFVLAGKVYEPTIRPDLMPLLRDQTPENVLFVPGFIDGEVELNSVINAIDAIFVDGSRYPVQSGVVCKAIHFGKCVVTPDSNSWTADLIHEWEVGISYRSMRDDLAGCWRQWRQNGGPDRSRKASQHLRSPSEVAKCFDSVSVSLLGVNRKS